MEIDGLPLTVELVKVQDFADGDICLMRLGEFVSREMYNRLAADMAAVFERAGVYVQVVVLPPDAEIEMLRQIQPSRAEEAQTR